MGGFSSIGVVFFCFDFFFLKSFLTYFNGCDV